ncbi:CD276 antigen-like [Pelmatolapia mariae]|uniref:CD276 antigen-like n=1 Tax=Pelmatolapia mariae TaxID=158779 RepID=UPI002FE60E4F
MVMVHVKSNLPRSLDPLQFAYQPNRLTKDAISTALPLSHLDKKDTTPVQGEVLVIGSNLPIITAPGDDVILPCHLEPTLDVQGLTVEWSKPDLKPDPSDRLSRVEYVHLYRDRKEVPDMKMASYFRRTELFMDDMKHGNISLKILNVSEEDNGRYRCFIPKLRSRVKAAVVELVVDPNYAKNLTTDRPLHPQILQTPVPQDTTPRNTSTINSLDLPSFPLLTDIQPVGQTLGQLSTTCRNNAKCPS